MPVMKFVDLSLNRAFPNFQTQLLHAIFRIDLINHLNHLPNIVPAPWAVYFGLLSNV